MTFVRTRLALDVLGPGRTLYIRLCGAEPIDNVPRMARQLGHVVVGMHEEAGGVMLLELRTRESPTG